ncbi:SIMPL domain-containing protein [Ahrensia kielensis]|uniref:SIMPL domain-containing protein n=1 Tax=Ahrensia kielensis TaxID=76980 RepID=UPI00036F55F4|nr:SIMPL domain-containing protein [Ahrensia kielensis]
MKFLMTPAIASLAVLGASVMSLPAMADESQKPTISVTGNGTANVAPDMAIISMGVTKEAETAREALNANTEAMKKVLEEMQSAGIEARDLQTSDFSIQPQYVYPNNSNDEQKPRITGYVVRNSLSVRVRDLEKVGDVLDASVSLGVNDGGNLVFTNDNPDEVIKQARSNAVKDAIAKAKTLAEAAGVELGAIKTISEQAQNDAPRPMAKMRSMEMVASSAPVPIAAGENSYDVTVNITFEIAQ